MANRRHFWIVVLALLCGTAGAQSDANTWQQLNLSSTTIEGATVYYERIFEPNLPFFEQMYQEFLTDKEKIDQYNIQKDQVLDEIRSIIGVDDPNAKSLHDDMWDSFMGTFSSIETTTFYFVKQSTVKDFLRTGGQLPNYSYDSADDIAIYNPNISATKSEPLIAFELTFPIESPDTFERDANLIFDVFQDFTTPLLIGVTIHEITEFCLLVRANQTDPFWRWFSDGVANAVAYELLYKYFSIEDANEFIKFQDVSKYSDLEKEINLRYWMSKKYYPLPEMPVETEKRFEYARYAYATLEVRRLVDLYGIGCITKIMDEISAKESRNGSDLIGVIKDVTGEDMNTRLDSYQSFEQSLEGRQKYVTAFSEAVKNDEYETMLFDLLRGNELFFEMQENNNYLTEYRYMALCLFKLDYEQQADQIMENILSLLIKIDPDKGRVAGLNAFTQYAIECNKPLKAREYAAELLEIMPEHGPSSLIQMLAYMEDRQFSQARKLAEKVVSRFDGQETPDYQVATKILAIDPNQLQ